MGRVQWLVVADHSPGAAPVLTAPLNMAELPVPVQQLPLRGVILTTAQVSLQPEIKYNLIDLRKIVFCTNLI